jgi:tetrahydromethanopterin S-methyltransferase subunit G
MASRKSKIDNEQNEKLNGVMIDMAEFKTDMKYTKKKLDKIETQLENFIKCADNKYASKRIELWIYGLVGFILTTIISIGMYKLF